MKHKIYCFNNSWSPGQERHAWNIGIALGDNGVCLAQHCSSSPEWCQHDITAEWKHENYDKAFGKDNWELVWIDDARNAKTHADEGFRAAVLLSEKINQPDNAPRVEVELTDGTKLTHKLS